MGVGVYDGCRMCVLHPKLPSYKNIFMKGCILRCRIDVGCMIHPSYTPTPIIHQK
jgi:hypothetical protein